MSKKKKVPEYYYYDACALEGERTYAEIINKRTPSAILSHLSLGEAYGACLSKSKTKSDCFVELINKLSNYIRIVGNDNINKQFEEVNNEISVLSITDAIHIATAIKYKCKSLRTLDQDLTGINKKKILKLGTKYNIPTFSISSIPLKK